MDYDIGCGNIMVVDVAPNKKKIEKKNSPQKKIKIIIFLLSKFHWQSGGIRNIIEILVASKVFKIQNKTKKIILFKSSFHQLKRSTCNLFMFIQKGVEKLKYTLIITNILLPQ